MWHYVKQYLPYAVLAALFMVGEVLMDLVQPGLMSRIVDEGVLGIDNNGVGDPYLILTLGLTMVVLVLFGGLCGSLNNVFVHLASQNIGNEIRKDCFRQIMTFSFPQIDRFGTGSLVTRVTNDITQVQNFVAQFVRGMIRTSMLTLGSIFFLFRLNQQFGLIVLCAFPFLLGCMMVCLLKAGPLLPKLQAQLDEINGILQEDVSGIRIIKACVRELYEKLRFGKANDRLIQTQLRVLVIFAFMNPLTNALMYLVVILLLLNGSHQVSVGTATPGVIMAAITYTTQMLNGILMLVLLFQNISKGLASWKRVKELLDSQPELQDGAFNEQTTTQGKIEFRDVSFAFPGTEQTVLQHINLTIQPGETVAIMGATGCGKTALVSLIPRFYDVTAGAVLVDDVDVREYQQQALRNKISIALQKSELFMELPDDCPTPDGMAIAPNGDLILACPNFADLSKPACLMRITKDGKISKWMNVPILEETGWAAPMGITFDDEGNLFICDNQGWSGAEKARNKGRILCLKLDGYELKEVIEVATGMEHPNGIRFRNGKLYVTQSSLSSIQDPSGLLVSGVYCFDKNDKNIKVTNTKADKNLLTTVITKNKAVQYGLDGIVFDKEDNLYVGNFGDGTIHRITMDPNGNVIGNEIWAQDPSQLRTTDGMCMDDDGNIWVADFSENAVARIDKNGRIQRIAQSPDCDGSDGGLDQPGEPIVWNGQVIVSCFDIVTGPDKVNTKHDKPFTLAKLQLN